MIKRITKTNFYRPKNPINKTGELSLSCFSRFCSNFIDKYDWGNSKKHLYNYRYDRQITKEVLNHSFTSTIKTQNSTFYKSNNYRLTQKDLNIHLHTKDKNAYVYYVNSQFSSCPLFSIDIDDLPSTTEEDLQKVISFLLKLHPKSYYEKSTNGKGIHFYLLLDLSDYLFIDSSYWNKVFNDYSNLIKLYINTVYNVDYDAIKATYSKYSFSKEHIPHLDKCGCLCKLPRPVTLPDYQRLYSIPFVSIDNINYNAKYIISMINAILEYTAVDSSTYTSFLSSICNIEYFKKWFKDKANKKEYGRITLNINNVLTNLSNPNIQTTVLVPKSSLNSKKQGLLNNSFEAETDWLLQYFRKYYKEHKQVPSLEQCYQSYKNDTGYSKTGQGREERFAVKYNYILKSFDSAKLTNRPKGVYYKKDYVEDLKKLLTEKELLAMQKEINPKFTGKITFEDISIAAGFYFVSLTRLLDKKTWSGKEFTVAQNNMKKWFSSLNSKFETARTCTNSNKVHILKSILIKLGWLSCIDDDYIICKQSRRHILTVKFPRYSEFEELVGQDNISKWINFSEQKKQIKTSA